jgi:hypothetical protein
LILGGGGDMAVNGEIRQELPNLFSTRVPWMTFIVKQNNSSNPLHVGLFGPETIVFGADSMTHLLS